MSPSQPRRHRIALALLVFTLSACGPTLPAAAPTPTSTLATAPAASASATASVSATPSEPVEVTWLRDHVQPWHTLDPIDADWRDLAPLGEAIGDATIVALGEPSHGDGAGFLANTRVIQYLHQELGFEVLVFESGLYDIGRAWEAISAGGSVETAFGQAAFPMYARSAQLLPLLNYIDQQRATDRPLILAGMDLQLSGAAAPTAFVVDLEQFLAEIGSDYPGWPALRETLTRLATFEYHGDEITITSADREAFAQAVTELKAEIDRRAPASEDARSAWWQQVLTSTERFAQSVWDNNWRRRNRPVALDRSLRDRQMAENVLWLAQTRYPDKKLILWAATIHLVRNPASITLEGAPDAYADFTSTGDYLTWALGDQVHTIAITAYDGEWAIAGSPAQAITPASPADLEGLIEATGLEYGFLDLRTRRAGDEWMHQPLQSVGLLGYSRATAVWPQALDGLLFIRTMTPSTSAND